MFGLLATAVQVPAASLDVVSAKTAVPRRTSLGASATDNPIVERCQESNDRASNIRLVGAPVASTRLP
jgi:hypothetical protein